MVLAGTPGRHAQDVLAAINEQPHGGGDVVLHVVTGHNRDKSQNQSGLQKQDVL
jgi:hypothetical protein